MFWLVVLGLVLVAAYMWLTSFDTCGCTPFESTLTTAPGG
jgi:hypothetical protein